MKLINTIILLGWTIYGMQHYPELKPQQNYFVWFLVASSAIFCAGNAVDFLLSLPKIKTKH